MTIISISFDNGPDPEVTPRVLDTLYRYDIKSTFFVLGDKLRDRRKFAQRAHAEGHWIGNHTYNHLVPLGMAAESGVASSEISRTQELIGDLAHERRFFRPLGGGGGGQLDQRLLNCEALQELINGHYTCVLWNVVPKDWAYPQGWVERALKLCFAQQHALIVLHDLPTGAMGRLKIFIDRVLDHGGRFRQDFPPQCVPIRRGEVVADLAGYVAA